jgi:hypothetical protein
VANVIRWLRDGDIEALVANMRKADIDEVTAATGRPLDQIIIDAIRSSTWVMALDVDDELGMIFGVAPMGSTLGATGAPWALGTTAVERKPRALIELGPSYCELMLASYPHLYNYVDARNKRSIRWLKWLGFEFHDAQPYGAAGLPFHKFEMRVKPCVNRPR